MTASDILYRRAHTSRAGRRGHVRESRRVGRVFEEKMTDSVGTSTRVDDTVTWTISEGLVSHSCGCVFWLRLRVSPHPDPSSKGNVER